MSKIGVLKLKNINELLDEQHSSDAFNYAENMEEIVPIQTPVKESKPRKARAAATTTKKLKKNFNEIVDNNDEVNKTDVKAAPLTASSKNTIARSSKKELLPGQMRIDTYYKSAAKNFKVESTPSSGKKEEPTSSAKKSNNKKTLKGAKKPKGRKRLFDDTTDTETTSATISESCFAEKQPKLSSSRKRKTPERPRRKQTPRSNRKKTNIEPLSTIDLCSDSETEVESKAQVQNECHGQEEAVKTEVTKMQQKKEQCSKSKATKASNVPLTKSTEKDCEVAPEEAQNRKQLKKRKSSPLKNATKTRIEPMICIPTENCLNILTPPISIKETSSNATTSVAITTATAKKRTRKPKPCPPYKVVEGTTFAVDAFQYGDIPNVTHYFLTHYHADHYIGLSGKFCHKLYVSEITARLVLAFMPLDRKYINILELNKPIKINDVEITAIDANHCPGAIMLIFKLPTGKCILHTGDFRASADMESAPAFWNNDISLLYLDTTYLNDKYDFCHQHESIDMAIDLVRTFREKHKDLRILYVCGAYVIGKEKLWTALALEFGLNVWTEKNRFKALTAQQNPDIDLLLCTEQKKAQMHVISLGLLSYTSLVDYFKPFEDDYDILLAIRPSGWEKNSRPQYRGRIYIIGIEYSEHSSYKELERFVKFLKPKEVISTVPTGRDLFVTAKIPQQWYKYDGYGSMSTKYQPTITAFVGENKRKIRPNVQARKRRYALKQLDIMSISPWAIDENDKNSKNINIEIMKPHTSTTSSYQSFETAINVQVEDKLLLETSEAASDVYEYNNCEISETTESCEAQELKESTKPNVVEHNESLLEADAFDDWIS